MSLTADTFTLPRSTVLIIQEPNAEEQFQQLQADMKKVKDKLPTYIFYTAILQLTSRIAHPNKLVVVVVGVYFYISLPGV